MTPSADESTQESQRQSFSLANMVPQTPKLNEVVWAHIEKVVRSLALKEGELYVVTGPVFGTSKGFLKHHVRVPLLTFKAIYDPRAKVAGAYLAENDNTPLRVDHQHCRSDQADWR